MYSVSKPNILSSCLEIFRIKRNDRFINPDKKGNEKDVLLFYFFIYIFLKLQRILNKQCHNEKKKSTFTKNL